jgi:tRNA nucleotidyltransferase (CCA-adding enzyme)
MDLITTHLNADFDGVASMVAARKLYPDARMTLAGGAQEAVRSFLKLHDLDFVRLKEVDLSQVSRLILVDTHDPDRLGPLKALCATPGLSVHVYDHHPHGDRADAGPDACLRPALSRIEPVGATTTVLIEALAERGIPLTPFEATVLALGLYEETGFFAYPSTTPRDLEAAARIVGAGADLNLVAEALRRPLDPEQVMLLHELVQSGETYYLEGRKVLLATSATARFHGDLAEAVHKLAEMEGLDAVVAAIAMDEKVEIIGRSRVPEIDVRRLAEEFGGGGHAQAAAASVKGQTLVQVRERLVRLLTERFRPTLLARDVMTVPAKTIGAGATIAETEACMTRFGVNVLPVVDRKDRYLGLITRESIQKALYHQLAKLPVEEFLHTEAYTAAPETLFRAVESRMLERNQRFVPVLQRGKVAGVITRTDLLRTLHDDVLGAARARAKGEEASPFAHHRDVRALLDRRLPERVRELLAQAGKTADLRGVAVFVVGGFVRDLLLERSNLDLDLVVEGDGIAYARALGQAVGARVTSHARFGTAVLIFPDGFKLDVATARTEYYEYPTALPTVERSSLKKDLARRDFTINTLAIRLNAPHFGRLIDFYGAQRDLHDKTIRVLHSLSFIEDPTRVFRAIRFEHRFGFRLGKDTLALIKGAVKMDLFRRLSGARLREELTLLLSEQEPRRAIARLGELDLLRFIHPQLKWSPRLGALLKAVEEVLDWHRLASLSWPPSRSHADPPWLLHLMALVDGLPDKAVREVLDRLAIAGREVRIIRDMRARLPALLRRMARSPLPSPAEVSHALAGLSPSAVLLLLAKTGSEPAKRQLSSYLSTYQHVRPMVTGTDLKALGLTPGPLYARVLGRLRDARLNGEVTNEAEERQLASRLVADAKPRRQ